MDYKYTVYLLIFVSVGTIILMYVYGICQVLKLILNTDKLGILNFFDLSSIMGNSMKRVREIIARNE